MDPLQAGRVIHERILGFEPEHIASKIMGYIYFHDYPKQEMIRLALGPDALIHSLIQKAKSEMMLYTTSARSPPIPATMSPSLALDASIQFLPVSPPSPLPFSSPVPVGNTGPYWRGQLVGGQQALHKLDLIPLAYPGIVQDEQGFHNHFMPVEDPLEEVNFKGSDFFGDVYSHASNDGNRNHLKTCHYFNKGFCKHGSNCRYYHGQQFAESCPLGFGPFSNEGTIEDQLFSPGSLEKLEREITELLKSRRGNPISIASLPLMYYEKYGRTLQAEGYLTESQRHGKAGYSLTKLLARLKNSIVLIDRPHGQHSVILAEDAAKYMELRGERNDPGPIVSGSRQIYLTFPAESSFTEEDVFNYFNTFGPVQDVRIPCQQKRMFGFVTFSSSDTVKMILSKGNPHYVCGARVLVKPYREKLKLAERKYQEHFELPMCFDMDGLDVDSERQAISAGNLCHHYVPLDAGWSFRLHKQQLMQEHEHAIELEARRLSQLCISRRPVPTRSCFGQSIEDLKLSEDPSTFRSAESSRFSLDNELINPCSKYADQESDGHNLPDSPFEPVGSSISSVS